ncbi:hypothetical protein Clacol_000475 [Clathrus columnatus]|uniref:Mediator complex subunit 9 n=1 Tax=Clathrus columnatus TaxID=1419009 RepID=A0AAV4ZWN4_9AGAM|nr:hypothetical protein Clacol_000475 [Clathrus columnatus]
MSKPPPQIPLPLSSLLHDLAVIRAHDLDLYAILSETTANIPTVTSVDSDINTSPALETSLENSREFVSHARAALKIKSSGELEKLGSRIERIRATMEDVLESIPGEDGEDSRKGI